MPVMRTTAQIPDYEILSQHSFTKPGIRLWLPVIMLATLVACSLMLVPGFGLIRVALLVLLGYVAICAVVSVCEITVVDGGLIIDRLLLPTRFVPWNAIDRVIVYSYRDGEIDTQIEVASVSFHEGLSPLNRLPGLVYGQGFRQTIVLTPDALEDYDVLLVALEAHCPITWHTPAR